MTVIFRSSGTATRSLGNINGIKPQDWRLFLDFEAEDYRLKTGASQERLTLSEVITCQRDMAAEYVDRLGLRQTADADVPRIHYLSDLERAGLLVEQARPGFVSNTDAPATQAIELPASINQYILRVEGEGSVQASGDVAEPVTVTGDDHAIFSTANSGEPNEVTLTVSGSPAYMQVEQLRSGVLLTRIHNSGSGTIIQPADYITLTAALFAEVMSGQSEITIAMQAISLPYAGGNDYPLVTSVRSDFGLLDAAGYGLTAGTTKSDTINRHGARYLADGSASQILDNIDFEGDRRFSTSVVGFSGTTMKHAAGGIVRARDLDGTPTATVLEIGAGNDWIPREHNGIFTKMVIFDRLLSDQELAEISVAWK